MKTSIALSAMIALTPACALAEDYLAQYREAGDECIANVDYLGGEIDCFMKVFDACNASQPIDFCMRIEADFWTEKLGPEYVLAMQEMTNQDEMLPATPSRGEILRISQGDWLNLHDSKCYLAGLIAGSEAPCYATGAFERVIYLIELQEPLQ